MATRERIKQEAQEAEKFMDEMAQKMAEAEAAKQPPEPVDISQILQGDEQTPPEPAPVAVPETPLIDTGEIAKLQAKIERLEAQLTDENSPTMKARWQTSQGILAKQSKEMEAIKAKLEELEKRPPAKAETPVADSEIYDILAEDLGEKSAKVLKPYLDLVEQQKAVIEELRSRLGDTEQRAERVEQFQTQTAEQRYYSELDAKVPNWRQINSQSSDPDSAWAKVLVTRPPGSRKTYNELLNEAHSDLDSESVAEIFKLVATETPAEPNIPRVDEHVEPPKTGKGAAPPPQKPEKRTYKYSEIKEFDRQKRAGILKGDPARIQAIFDDMQDAIMDNRVRYD